MPRQQHRANTAPYTKVLSALLKPELIRLCTDFRLPADGSVVTLRQRLKGYINLHRDLLFANPRYTALFSRHQRILQRTPSPTRSPPSTHSPALSYTSNRSFSPWNGIDDQPQEPQHPLPAPQDLHGHYYPPPSPSVTSSGHSSATPSVAHDIGGRKYLFIYFIIGILFSPYFHTYHMHPMFFAAL